MKLCSFGVRPRLSLAVPLLMYATAPLALAADPSATEIAQLSSRIDKITAWKASVEIVDSSNNQVQRKRQGDLGTTMPNGDSDSKRSDTQRFYHFNSPQDIRGTALLIHEHAVGADDIWLYLPTQGKARRIAGSAKKNSFVGTQYSFADLTSFEHERYKHQVSANETCAEQRPCWVLESTPLEESYAQEIGYGKQRAWVLKDNYRTTKIEYYDLSGALLKTQVLADFIAVGNKALAQSRTMSNHRNGQSTSIKMSAVNFKPTFGSGDFSAQHMGGE